MEKLKGLVLCLGAGAILIGILSEFTNSKSGSGIVFRISAGIFLVLQILQPAAEWNPEFWSDYFAQTMAQAEAESNRGTEYADSMVEEIITDRTRAYILDKAEAYHASLNVEVALDEGGMPAPVGITVSGDISPYGKKSLQRIIENDLNIPRERQIWIGQ